LLKSLTLFFFFGIEAKNADGWLQFGSLHWPNYEYIGIPAYLALHVSAGQTWIVLFLNLFIEYFLNLALYFGAAIAVIRLSGVYVPRFIVRPYLAKSFNEYYRRSLYFYSECVIHFFLLPSWQQFHLLRNQKKTRLLLCLFLSVGLGGWFLHVLWGTNYFLVYEWPVVLSYFLSWAPYYALVSLACWVSALDKSFGSAKIPHWISLGTIVTVHGVLFALLPLNPIERWNERLHLLASLVMLR
jgi:D-alanyl-lipoteichoic acid acyltransferase DltB (MBOAT superfamily)